VPPLLQAISWQELMDTFQAHCAPVPEVYPPLQYCKALEMRAATGIIME